MGQPFSFHTPTFTSMGTSKSFGDPRTLLHHPHSEKGCCVSCNEDCATMQKCSFFPCRNDPEAGKRGECPLIRQNKKNIVPLTGFLDISEQLRGTRGDGYILILLLTREGGRGHKNWKSRCTT